MTRPGRHSHPEAQHIGAVPTGDAGRQNHVLDIVAGHRCRVGRDERVSLRSHPLDSEPFDSLGIHACATPRSRPRRSLTRAGPDVVGDQAPTMLVSRHSSGTQDFPGMGLSCDESHTKRRFFYPLSRLAATEVLLAPLG